MKNNTLIVCGLLLMLSFSCEVEPVSAELDAMKKRQPAQEAELAAELAVDLDELENPCTTVNLIAGQHYVAGNVAVYNDGENLIVVYTATGDWVLGETHLSLGNCDEEWVPTTRSGNPKIGKFDYTEPYSVSDQEVVYVIPLDGLNDNYCFAAHAVVEGPDGGETAWAEGSEFSGKSWAMFVESSLSDCPPTDEPEDDDDDDPFIPT